MTDNGRCSKFMTYLAAVGNSMRSQEKLIMISSLDESHTSLINAILVMGESSSGITLPLLPPGGGWPLPCAGCRVGQPPAA